RRPTLPPYQIFDGPRPSLVQAFHQPSPVLRGQREAEAPLDRPVLPATPYRPARPHLAHWDAAQNLSVSVLLPPVCKAGPGPHLLLHSTAQFLAVLPHNSCPSRDSADNTRWLRAGADSEPPQQAGPHWGRYPPQRARLGPDNRSAQRTPLP